MFRRFWSGLRDSLVLYLLAVTVAGLLVLAAVAAPGVAGWYVGSRWFGHGDWGAVLPYCVAGLVWLLTDRRVARVFVHGLVAFVFLVPAIYVLLLVVRVTLLVTGLVRFGGPVALLWAGTVGVPVGCGLMVVFTIKGVLNGMAEHGGRRFDPYRHFRDGLSIRVPFALAIAALAGLPAGTGVLIVVGLFWGVVAGVCAVLHNALVDRAPMSEALWDIAFTELLLGFVLVIGVLDGLFDHKALAVTLELVPAAGAACIVTYLVARLAARTGAASRARDQPAAVPE